MRRKNPDSSEFVLLAAVAGLAWWLFRTKQSLTAPAANTAGQMPAQHFQNQFTDTFGLHCEFPQTLQGRDSILGCYDPGANGPTGTAFTRAFLAANPKFIPPASALILP